ncbi:MAG: 23S rRNA (guanosine(2251)-2'-O)-methyltransferase RlmB [Xanthomonadales bacterium]|nr:23S rRNA (guanosine(2251)-2'-O)-methyltransferase RlmB [Gammaproteobacteria bacterium]NNE05109.1 23S rRNA (guanosine(2251)-2'-O)-methyltransferase RlmB [Xanthomonadales bacterium]NNL94443.1 23S rRNA (guanosine(2251)-2'-O)-methyltransferase RlmB [Xanthomonadales bacterium]
MRHSKEKQQLEAQLVIGVQAVAAAIKNNPSSIRLISVTSDSANQRVSDLVMLAQDAGIEVRRERREWLDQVCADARHQDIIAQLYKQQTYSESDLVPFLREIDEDPLVLVLDGVQDPHNLGACLRTAESAGCHAVVFPKDKAVGLTPAVRKTSAGASEIVPLFQVTNLARSLRLMKEAGIWLAGASDSAERSIYDHDLRGPLALVMGGEGKGLRRLTAEMCDYLVRIPMAGAIESLNVSVATGVCLYEIQRQRKAR